MGVKEFFRRKNIKNSKGGGNKIKWGIGFKLCLTYSTLNFTHLTSYSVTCYQSQAITFSTPPKPFSSVLTKLFTWFLVKWENFLAFVFGKLQVILEKKSTCQENCFAVYFCIKFVLNTSLRVINTKL